jgi:lysophospholipase L1-like esterase
MDETTRSTTRRTALALLLMLVLALGSRALAHAGILSDSIDAIGDSITRGFDANSCTYRDQVDRNWATGDNHGTSYCSSGSDSTFSHAERLECAKPGEIINLNDAESGATMRGDFAAQSTTARANLIASPAPRYVAVFMGHNDACSNTENKTGNGCGGDQDPNNYCRTTTTAFEREFREGMDQLIQVPSSRILVSALVRISELCNFGSKSSCGAGFGTSATSSGRT